jgi:PAS domain S-box-containing protein
VFGCEFAVMMVLSILRLTDGVWEAVIDSLLLSLLVVPGLAVLGLVNPPVGRVSAGSGMSGKLAPRRVLSLRNQFVVILIALAVGPLAWLGWSVGETSTRALEDEAESIAMLSLVRDAHRIETDVERLRRDVRYMAQYPPVQGLLRCRDAGGVDPRDGSTSSEWSARLGRLFAAYAESTPYVRHIRYVGDDGREWVRVTSVNGVPQIVPSADRGSVASRAYFTKTIVLPAGQCHVTARGVAGGADDGSRQEISLDVASPVWREGQARGAIVLSVDPRRIFEGMGAEYGGDVSIATRRGECLFHTDKTGQQSDGSLDVHGPWRELVEALDSGTERVTTRDRIWLVTRIQIDPNDPDEQWLLARHWDTASLFGMSKRLRETTVSAVLGVAAVAMSLALIMAAVWSRPVTQLATAARRFGAGDFTVRIGTSRRDEFGDMGRAFDHMADAIADTTKNLESRVRERTHELGMMKRALDEHAIVSVTDIRGTITDANDKFCQISGFSREELLGNNHRLLKSGEHSEEFYRDLWLTVSQGKTWRGQVKNRKKDGSCYWVDATIVPFADEEGVVTQYIAIRTDVTKQKEAAEENRAFAQNQQIRKEETQALNMHLIEANEQLEDLARKAELATSAKSDFLANMSHEIRTPITAIHGFSTLLLRQADEGNEADRREWLSTIRTSSEHLLALINDILDLSKIESGQLETERVPCSPHEIITEVLSIQRLRATDKGLRLEATYSSPIPAVITSDPTRLRQVLTNLLGNAVKFTVSGSVRINTHLIDVDDDQEPILAIEVIDTGCGIRSDKLEAVFSPFVQADASVTRRYGGTGLGLTISRRIADMLGGGLTVSSTEGDGTVFTLAIDTGPLDGVEMLEHPSEALSTHSHETDVDEHPVQLHGRVLLVDDGDTNRKLIGLVLRRAGVEVTMAENGQECLNLVRDARDSGGSFDVILMDMQMPVMDGYTAATRLREQGFAKPILALTAHAMKGDREKCVNAGCTGFMSKPVDIDELIRTVARCLRRASRVDVPSHSGAVDACPSNSAIVSVLPMGDPDFRSIVEEFVTRLSEQLEAMRSACESHDFRAVANLAHWLKGAAGTVGLADFTGPAIRLENLSAEERLDEVEDAIADIQQLADRIAIDPADDIRDPYSTEGNA